MHLSRKLHSRFKVLPVIVYGEHFECESLPLYGLLNFKHLMANHDTFNSQLDHVSVSLVHA